MLFNNSLWNGKTIPLFKVNDFLLLNFLIIKRIRYKKVSEYKTFQISYRRPLQCPVSVFINRFFRRRVDDWRKPQRMSHDRILNNSSASQKFYMNCFFRVFLNNVNVHKRQYYESLHLPDIICDIQFFSYSQCNTIFPLLP